MSPNDNLRTCNVRAALNIIGQIRRGGNVPVREIWRACELLDAALAEPDSGEVVPIPAGYLRYEEPRGWVFNKEKRAKGSEPVYFANPAYRVVSKTYEGSKP